MAKKRPQDQQNYTPDRRDLPLDQLELDGENPRLAHLAKSNRRFDLLQILWREMDVAEIIYSIAENGFFREETLFAIPKSPKKNGDKYVVVEGNRRLAAVLILTNNEYRERLGATDMPQISEAQKRDLLNLPVSIYETREQLWSYLSFRHINSPRPWDAFSKAKYVAQVYEGYNIPLDEIAARIGDRHSTVERLYRGYKVVQQAESEGKFDIEDRWRNKFYFSHLYTALDYPEFQKFLGITAEGSLRDNPVPKSKLDNLYLIMKWLYGKKSENVEPVVQTQNPDLGMLRDILGKKSAIASLSSGYGLKKAYEESIGDERLFNDAITSAKQELQQARALVSTGYFGDEELLDVARNVEVLAADLREDMEKKHSSSTKRRS